MDAPDPSHEPTAELATDPPADATASDDRAEPSEARPSPSRRTLYLILTPLAIIIVVSLIGDALAPTLFDSHPLLLIAMNARNRNLFLTVNNIDPVAFYVVATARLMLSDPLFYLLGYFYGDRALEFAERKSSSTAVLIERINRIFKRAAYPLIVIAPNNIICLLAGTSGIKPRWFFLWNFVGTIGRLVLIAAFGEATEPWINGFGDFIARYRIWFLVATISVAALTGWNELKEVRRAGTELGGDEVDADTAD